MLFSFDLQRDAVLGTDIGRLQEGCTPVRRRSRVNCVSLSCVETVREAAGTAESTAICTVRADDHRLSASRGGQKVWIWTVHCGQRHDVGFPGVSADKP